MPNDDQTKPDSTEAPSAHGAELGGLPVRPAIRYLNGTPTCSRCLTFINACKCPGKIVCKKCDGYGTVSETNPTGHVIYEERCRSCNGKGVIEPNNQMRNRQP